jgi:undecaprenyl-diphosphatase
VWGVVVLGIVQGVAEFLPVSSSGHLLLLGHWLGVRQTGASLEVLLHVGTLAAVATGLREELATLWSGLRRGDANSWRLVGQIAVASLPAAVAGGVGGAALAQWLFRPAVAGVGFLVTSALLWSAPAPRQGGRHLEELTWADALVVGIAQAFALTPGLSRSGATMAAARHRGLAPEAAARFSFLLLVPVTVGAAALNAEAWAGFGVPALAAAALAAVVGLFALQWAIKAVQSRTAWRAFAAYTAGLAVLAWIRG